MLGLYHRIPNNWIIVSLAACPPGQGGGIHQLPGAHPLQRRQQRPAPPGHHAGPTGRGPGPGAGGRAQPREGAEPGAEPAGHPASVHPRAAEGGRPEEGPGAAGGKPAHRPQRSQGCVYAFYAGRQVRASVCLWG